eukprot:CAMPEP_0177256122 /NCGR_PEP_ID=MMETSP0367-20130122/56756_1 /TAXON_ID=447022 ORGANISM="Scrippsiella hangoei-like, Strain SHHI-4" /NCGR_SAMPLE_ID=MMETSP0367 /ASSEMBLY_ACC=CAM_ASM_000362 /LENGTH=39 /DNA_ID= /DNA_START= /DNA_END= /DNA_ORIENTATION=
MISRCVPSGNSMVLAQFWALSESRSKGLPGSDLLMASLS